MFSTVASCQVLTDGKHNVNKAAPREMDLGLDYGQDQTVQEVQTDRRLPRATTPFEYAKQEDAFLKIQISSKFSPPLFKSNTRQYIKYLQNNYITSFFLTSLKINFYIENLHIEKSAKNEIYYQFSRDHCSRVSNAI